MATICGSFLRKLTSKAGSPGQMIFSKYEPQWISEVSHTIGYKIPLGTVC